MKKWIALLLIVLMALLTACDGGAVKEKEEVKKLTEEFYSVLETADNFAMTTYSGDEPVTLFKKDGDKMYVKYFDEEFGYDYYLFMEDGKKYVVTDTRDLFEDESTYDDAADTISTMLAMLIYGNFDAEAENLSYSAEAKGDNELVTTIKGENDGTKYTVTLTGKKEDGKVTSLISEIKADEVESLVRNEFTYDEHIEIPEYKVAKVYDNMPHVASPFKTVGDIIAQYENGGMPDYSFVDYQLIVIDEKDGRYYQFTSNVTLDTLDRYGELDSMSDDYEEQVRAILSPLAIDDCIDFTDEIMSQEEAARYIGKEVQAMLDDGFEITGYSFWGDENHVWVAKDFLAYDVKVELPAGFDPDAEFDSYDGFTVLKVLEIEFDYLEPGAIPMT